VLPSTVTLIDPVRAAFVTATPLTEGPMNVNASDTLPTATLVVIATRRASTTPAAALHSTALADVHAVASPRLPPVRDRTL
jgi:hypothetical protein